MTTDVYDERSDRLLLLFGGIASLVFDLLLFTQTQASLTLIMLLVGLMLGFSALASAKVQIQKSLWNLSCLRRQASTVFSYGFPPPLY